MITRSEAQAQDYEDRTGDTPPVELVCGACGHRWSAPTRWGDFADPDDENCPCCGWVGEIA